MGEGPGGQFAELSPSGVGQKQKSACRVLEVSGHLAPSHKTTATAPRSCPAPPPSTHLWGRAEESPLFGPHHLRISRVNLVAVLCGFALETPRQATTGLACRDRADEADSETLGGHPRNVAILAANKRKSSEAPEIKRQL